MFLSSPMLFSRWRVSLFAVLVLLQACTTTPGPAIAPPPDPARFTANFESGSLGAVRPPRDAQSPWQLSLRDDNGDSGLPASFRTWFYFKASNLAPGRPLRLSMTGWGSRYPVLPVYSLDGRHWQAFEAHETAWHSCGMFGVTSCTLDINKDFGASQVWIARTYPYTTQDLAAYLGTISTSPYLQRRTLGVSPEGRPIDMLTVAGPDAASQDARSHVWLQARSHPGETGPSWVLEGLLARLLADDETGQSLRRHHIFHIVPMHNPDGVVAGNYRTNTASVNLENSWTFEVDGSDAPGAPPPVENQALLRQGILPILAGGGQFELALNLHSSNAAIDAPAFFLPHFGGDATQFDDAERRLWERQQHLIALVGNRYAGRIGVENEQGGRAFLRHAFPETWWWHSQQDRVNAITLETTYGHAGFGRQATPDDLRALGDALALAINDIASSKAACAYITAPLPAFCVGTPAADTPFALGQD